MRLRLLLTLAIASITCAFVTIAAAADLAQVSPSNQRQVNPPKSTTPTAAPASPPAAPPAPTSALINTGPGGDYTIGIDDLLHIIVWENKELEQDVVVRPDGKISFPLVGELYVRGLTVPRVEALLKERLSAAVRNPNVSVIVKEIRSFRVYLVGKVAKPGVYPLKAGTPLLQAITLSGGTVEGADLPAAYIIRADKKIPVDLRRLIQDGDLSKNIKLETEDTIVVPEIT